MTIFKKCIFSLIAVSIFLVTLEFFLGYILWIRGSLTPSLFFMGKRIYIKMTQNAATGSIVASCYPYPINVPNEYLGTCDAPGSYTITLEDRMTGKSHSYDVTIDERGNRITSYDSRPFLGKRQIWIFGDSFAFGEGNNDETTFPFLLQHLLRDFHIVNYAHRGYGNIHAYLQIKKEFENKKRGPEIIVIVYGNYFLPRNVAAPSRLKKLWFDKSGASGRKSEYRHPKGLVKNGRLEVGYVPLFPDNLCSEQEPTGREQIEVTNNILREIYDIGEKHSAKMILAFTAGADSDEVVMYARQIGYEISDLRPNANRKEWDDFSPLDGHPGPLAQNNYARKLSKTISKIVSNRFDDRF